MAEGGALTRDGAIPIRRSVYLAANVLVWTALAGIIAASTSLTYVLEGREPRWSLTAASALTEWYPWVALTPLVVLLSWRLRRMRQPTIRRALALAVIGWPVANLKITISGVVRAFSGADDDFHFTTLVGHYVVFWGVVGVAHVALYYRGEHERERRASEAERRLLQSQLETLRAQLHPHFLFNTLNTIAELVHENPAAAERMIGGLGELLRTALDTSGKDLISVTAELDLLERYLSIQRERFGMGLRTSVQLEAPELGNALVPVFILQPLAENAIKHGIGTTSGGGRLDVRVTRTEERIVLTVTDDGPGLPNTTAWTEGVGLSNTRARLAAIYDRAASLVIESAPSGGTCVRVFVPWRTS